MNDVRTATVCSSMFCLWEKGVLMERKNRPNAWEGFINSLEILDSFKGEEETSLVVSEYQPQARYIMELYNLPNNTETLNIFTWAIERANDVSLGVANQSRESYYNFLLIWTWEHQPDPKKAVWFAFLLGIAFNELFGEEEPPY